MLNGLSIRDIVLVEALDLEVGRGLTVLTGETGAGKSIILDALGLATGGRSDAGLVRAGRPQGSATALFTAPDDAELLADLQDRGLEVAAGEELVLRRVVGADGKSRAFINDQAVPIGTLKSVGQALIEVHGQHETVGLLDWKTHRARLDGFGGHEALLAQVATASAAVQTAEGRVETLKAEAQDAARHREELVGSLAELDSLDPRPDEEADLAGERALLGAAEKAIGDLKDAQDQLGGDTLTRKVASALRAVEHARQRAGQAGADGSHPVIQRLGEAAEALDRTLSEAQEALAAIDAAADAFEFEPGQLDRTEERLFALRAMARKLNTSVELLPVLRERFREQLRLIEDGEGAIARAELAAAEARKAYDAVAAELSVSRTHAGQRLTEAVMAELAPLKLERARFRVELQPVEGGRRGPQGQETARFQIATNAGTDFGPLDAIASGGELARFALALKASLAGREGQMQPVMIFDEVDQGVGGAVAEAVGDRLRRLADGAQVLVVTHSPQVAAAGHGHWKVRKAEADGVTTTTVDILDADARREEVARMLSGATITDEARAAADVLIG